MGDGQMDVKVDGRWMTDGSMEAGWMMDGSMDGWMDDEWVNE